MNFVALFVSLSLLGWAIAIINPNVVICIGGSVGSRVLKRRTATKRKKPFVGVLVTLAVLTALFAGAGVAVWSVGESWLQDLPDYEDQKYYELAQKTRVFASDGETLLAEFFLEDREPVTQDDIGDYVWAGTVATEDERFYSHKGVDPQGIARAVFVNVTGLSHEGASTITQQLVRNTVLASEASESTLKRKVREAYIAIKLEQIHSKDEILLKYLNTINYGSGCYGIQAASQKYFSKDATDLNLTEAAALIGIPQSPTMNNPIDYPDNCLKRRNVVLLRMLSNNLITQDQYDKAVQKPLGLKLKKQTSRDGIYKYHYFTSYVRDQLIEKYGEDTVFTGGMDVYTTLNVSLQKKAEKAAREKEKHIDKDMEVAFTVINPSNGAVKAMVGGRDYRKNEFNLATQAQRQAGSSFKTFTLLASIEAGINPKTNINCSSRVNLDGWQVENFDAANYGTRSIASAFEVSSNTGFARLCTFLGPEKVVDVAQRCGITSTLSAVPSITLGSQGVTTLEMANAYATIANGGTYHEAYAISRITDSDGKTIYKHKKKSEKALEPEVAAAATQVMQGVVSRGTGTDARPACGQVAAGKTGTTENFRDSWFCGFTPQYAVAIWMGTRQERTMTPGLTAASVFRGFIDRALKGKSLKAFPTAGTPEYKSVNDKSLGIGGKSSSSKKKSSSTTSSSTSSSSGGGGGSSSSTTPKPPKPPTPPVDPEPVDPEPSESTTS